MDREMLESVLADREVSIDECLGAFDCFAATRGEYQGSALWSSYAASRCGKKSRTHDHVTGRHGAVAGAIRYALDCFDGKA